MSWFKRFGPGLLVTAAFMGPGTVTTASFAGFAFGNSLLWVVLFAVIAAVVLQEMSSRLGLVTRAGLGEALRASFDNPVGRTLAVVLVVAAITFGNAAYQTGNITGAALGLSELTPVPRWAWCIITGALAMSLLASGTYRMIERMLVLLVGLMSVVFIATAIMVKPDLGEMVRGALVPSMPSGSGLTVIALIGTTVVPYNLFLHAAVVREKWPASRPVDEAIRESRVDTFLAVSLGGLVTLAIIVTAAVFFQQRAVFNFSDMARQLEPLLGRWAKLFFAAGLAAAGLTSAITAPLAAAYATTGMLGWPVDLRSWKFRAVWLTVALVGTTLAAVGKNPLSAIIFAQAANGLILPMVAVFLLVVVNRRRLLGRHVNGVAANVLGGLIVIGVGALGIWKLFGAAGKMFGSVG